MMEDRHHQHRDGHPVHHRRNAPIVETGPTEPSRNYGLVRSHTSYDFRTLTRDELDDITNMVWGNYVLPQASHQDFYRSPRPQGAEQQSQAPSQEATSPIIAPSPRPETSTQQQQDEPGTATGTDPLLVSSIPLIIAKKDSKVRKFDFRTMRKGAHQQDRNHMSTSTKAASTTHSRGVEHVQSRRSILFSSNHNGLLWRARLAVLTMRAWTALESSLWTIPVISVIVNFGLGLGLAAVDYLKPDVHRTGYTVFFRGSAAEAAGFLEYVGSFTISLTGTVFSLSIVAFQVAAVNYSPRILQDLMREYSTKMVLATFLGTFAYSYGVLLSVKDTDTSHYSPQFAVNFLIFYVCATLIGLVYYLDSVVRSLSVSKLLDDIAKNTIRAIHQISAPMEEMPKEESRILNFRKRTRWKMKNEDDTKIGTSSILLSPASQKRGSSHDVNSDDELDSDVDHRIALPLVPAEVSRVVIARASGFVLSIMFKQIAQIATHFGVLIRFRTKVGDFVTKGSVIAWVWLNPIQMDAYLSDHILDLLTGQVHWCLYYGPRRTVDQDLLFAMKQLTDVASKAMSPAINDPSTAVETLDRVEMIFSELVLRYIDPIIIRKNDLNSWSKRIVVESQRVSSSPDNPIRAAFPSPSFSDLLNAAMHPLRYYGCTDVAVSRRALYVLGTIGALVSKHERKLRTRLQCIEKHIELIVATCSTKHTADSPEFESILFAAKHANFLIQSGRSAVVHVYESSSSSEASPRDESDAPDPDPNLDLREQEQEATSSSKESLFVARDGKGDKAGAMSKRSESSQQRKAVTEGRSASLVRSGDSIGRGPAHDAACFRSFEPGEVPAVFEDLVDTTKHGMPREGASLKRAGSEMQKTASEQLNPSAFEDAAAHGRFKLGSRKSSNDSSPRSNSSWCD